MKGISRRSLLLLLATGVLAMVTIFQYPNQEKGCNVDYSFLQPYGTPMYKSYEDYTKKAQNYREQNPQGMLLPCFPIHEFSAPPSIFDLFTEYVNFYSAADSTFLIGLLALGSFILDIKRKPQT